MCHLPMPPPWCTRRKGRTLTKGSGFLLNGSAGAHLSSPGRRRSPVGLVMLSAKKPLAPTRLPGPSTFGADEAPF